MSKEWLMDIGEAFLVVGFISALAMVIIFITIYLMWLFLP